MATLETSPKTPSQNTLTSSSAEARVKTSASREREKAWAASILALPRSLSALQESTKQDGSCGKTYRAQLHPGGGADFVFICQELNQCGYGVAWRILDAQHFGVPQCRKRLFLVGYLGDWRPATAVLCDEQGSGGDFVSTQEEATDNSATASKRAVVYDFHGQDASVRPYTDVAPTVTARWGTGGNNVPVTFIQTESGERLRFLTPEETEKLQGFPLGYTNIGKGGKASPKGQRYKALGNAMAVPAMRWLGQRIELVEEVRKEKETKE